MSQFCSVQRRIMHAGVTLTAVFLLNACVNDRVSERQPGQQLVCHKGYTKAVTSGDYMLHRDHGDTVGPCPEER